MVQALAKRLWSKTSSACTRGFHRVKQDGPGQFQFWLIALFIGIAAGGAAVLFRMAISFLQEMFYGADDEMLASTAAELPWFWVLIIPIIGGLVVGLILQAFTPDGRSRSLA
ncbi:MAG: chloride channel protein, partial [Pseudomonadota bacterium]